MTVDTINKNGHLPSSLPSVALDYPVSQEPVVVVGAGVGGLAAAIDLARAGLPVTVIDSASVPGGKLRELTVAGARIDSGATVL